MSLSSVARRTFSIKSATVILKISDALFSDKNLMYPSLRFLPQAQEGTPQQSLIADVMMSAAEARMRLRPSSSWSVDVSLY
jgi:hypothetical protein